MNRNSISIDIGGVLAGLVVIALMVILPAEKSLNAQVESERNVLESSVSFFYEKAKKSKEISIREYEELLDIAGRMSTKYRINIVVGESIFFESQKQQEYRFTYINEIADTLDKKGVYELGEQWVLYIRVNDNAQYTYVIGGVI